MSKANDKNALLNKARQIGPATGRACLFHFESRSVTEAVFFCSRIQKLAEQYGREAVEEACEWFQQNDGYPELEPIRTYVQKRDRICFRIPENFAEKIHATGGITRGPAQFSDYSLDLTKQGG
ncbi:MAG: hypothetical protein IJ719_09125 [Clostridia bacterium]|nr:hypothetical protein [Clostridia bacterium]